MSSLSFRPVSPADIPLLNSLMRAGKGHWGYPEEGLDRFMSTFALTEDSFKSVLLGYVMEQAGKVKGYYTFTSEGGNTNLDLFFLEATCIGQGYGRIMWEHCIQQVSELGVESFVIWADPYARAFYEHMGAVKVDERPMVTLPGGMAPIMAYSLQSSVDNSLKRLSENG